jgi:hypothetical protein
MGTMKNAPVQKPPKVKRPVTRSWRKWDDNIKTEIGWEGVD